MSFEAILSQGAGLGATGNAGLTAVSPPPAWAGFRPLNVTDIERESESVISVYLADPDGTGVPPAQPGQFLTLRLPADKGRKSILRSYSLSGAPGASTYRVSVKREPHGVGSQFVHDRVRRGDRLDVAAPRGTFILRPSDAPVLLLSAGVGATPVLAMLHALEGTQSSRDVWWLHGARNRAEEPFAAESRSLLEALPSGHRYVCYSRPSPADAAGRDYQRAGRLTASVLATLDLPRDCRCVYLRPGRVHGGDGQRTRGPRRRCQPDTHRDLRPGTRDHAWCDADPDPLAAPSGRVKRPTVRRSASPAAASPCTGIRAMPACWTSPRRATYPLGGHVGPAFATPAKRVCSPGRSATLRTRLTTQLMAMC